MIYSARAAVNMRGTVNPFPLLPSCCRAQLQYRDRFTITLRLPENLAAYGKGGNFGHQLYFLFLCQTFQL